MYNLGKLLKELRDEKDISMDKMIDDLKDLYSISIAKSTISKWENNKADPSMENAKLLCNYFNVSLDYLLGLSKYKNKEEELNSNKFQNYNSLENELTSSYNKLNDLGKKEAVKRVEELTHIDKYKNAKVTELPKKKEIWEEEGKEHLMPIACHDDGLTDEEKKNMDDKISQFLKKLNK